MNLTRTRVRFAPTGVFHKRVILTAYSSLSVCGNGIRLFFAVTALVSASLFSCSNPYRGVSPEIARLARRSVSGQEPQRAAELHQMTESIDPRHREGMAYLLAYMPERDLAAMECGLIKENIEYAYRARDRYAWCRDLPDDIFFNEVLPYHVADEKRMSWRPELFDLTFDIADPESDLRTAVDSLCRRIKGLTGVRYTDRLPKENLSSAETIELGGGGSTALAILMVSAFRSAGIPARMAGTPMWSDHDGHYSWAEVWIDGGWHFVDYFSDNIDDTWFLERAGQTEKSDPSHWIYAATYAPGNRHFPLAWNDACRDLHAIDVTDRYIKEYKRAGLSKNDGIEVSIRMYGSKAYPPEADDRVAVKVRLVLGDSCVAQGVTASAERDVNDRLVLNAPCKGNYAIEWMRDTTVMRRMVRVDGEKPVDVALFME